MQYEYLKYASLGLCILGGFSYIACALATANNMRYEYFGICGFNFIDLLALNIIFPGFWRCVLRSLLARLCFMHFRWLIAASV